jgi:hypothetical protein
MPLSALLRRLPPAVALVVLAALACASGLAAASGLSRALPLGAIEVSARGAPTFGFIPTSRRDEAVLRSQPELQMLGVGTTLGKAKLARLQGDRIARRAGTTGRRRPGLDGDGLSGRPSGGAAARLRAPPSPA